MSVGHMPREAEKGNNAERPTSNAQRYNSDAAKLDVGR